MYQNVVLISFWVSNTSGSVSNLGSLTHKAGPNVLLKVMAGDQLSATTQYYYQNPVTNTTGNNLTTSIITALIQSILGSPATGLAKGNTTPISTQLNADPLFLSKTAPDANNATGTNPKAYMTIVFFDERFNYVAENSMALRVSQQGDNAAPLVLANIKAPKNGFAYIYLSNESNEPVYFDNFTVSDNRGRIIEEDHYYAYGLKIAGISSKKLPDPNEGNIDNKNLYNDKELVDDADLDWYDYGFRNYDPQIGRFTQLDPLTDDYPELTNYQYASNEPIGNVDMDGLEKIPSLAPVIIYKSLPKAASTASKGLSILNVGFNTLKIGAAVADHTIVASLGQKHSLDHNVSSLQTQSYLSSLFNKFGDWFDRIGQGSGSYQDYGISFTGNDNGTMEFRDHVGTLLDEINIGPLFGAMKAFGLDPKVFEELLSSPAGLKYVAHLLEADKTVLETHETVKEVVRTAKGNLSKSKLSLKKHSSSRGDSIYVDDFKYETNSNGDTIKTTYGLKLIRRPKK